MKTLIHHLIIIPEITTIHIIILIEVAEEKEAEDSIEEEADTETTHILEKNMF